MAEYYWLSFAMQQDGNIWGFGNAKIATPPFEWLGRKKMQNPSTVLIQYAELTKDQYDKLTCI